MQFYFNRFLPIKAVKMKTRANANSAVYLSSRRMCTQETSIDERLLVLNICFVCLRKSVSSCLIHLSLANTIAFIINVSLSWCFPRRTSCSLVDFPENLLRKHVSPAGITSDAMIPRHIGPLNERAERTPDINT